MQYQPKVHDLACAPVEECCVLRFSCYYAGSPTAPVSLCRKGITTYFLPGTSTPAPQCAESAYNADTCAKHLLFLAQVRPQLPEPDIIRESARLCQLPAENGLGIASAQAQAHKKRGRSDVAQLSRSVHANVLTQ